MDGQQPERSEMVRVVCTLENASGCINGVRFGPIARRSAGKESFPFVMSEPMPREQADIFKTINGYEAPQPGDLEQADSVDQAIAHAIETEAAARVQQPGNPNDQRTIQELERANLAMSAELGRLREVTVDPEQAKELVALRTENTALKAENKQLRDANAKLAGQPSPAGKKSAAA